MQQEAWLTHPPYCLIIFSNDVSCEFDEFRVDTHLCKLAYYIAYLSGLLNLQETKGALRPQPWNWKSLLMSALVLSSKVRNVVTSENCQFLIKG